MKSNKELIEELKSYIAISNFERIDASNEINKGGKYIVKKFITIITTALAIFAGSITVYAAMGGEIAGKPVIEWLGLKFSDEYENYKVSVDNQEAGSEETKVELVSTVCDDGYTILEFDVKLSKEDKEYLRIGEKVVTEEDIEDAIKRDRETPMAMLSQDNPDYDLTNPSNPEHYLDGEGPNYRFMMKYKDVLNTISLKFNSKESNDELNNREVILDDEHISLRPNFQKVTKISDYEFKVYQIYFFTEDELSDKTDFKLTFKDILIKNIAEAPSEKIEDNFFLGNTEHNARVLPIDGLIEVNLSKKNAQENCKIFYNNQEVTYKTMTQKIEEIKVTPLQIIVKLNLVKNDVSSNSLGSISNPNYIGIEGYKVYDNNGNELDSYSFRANQIITYEDGEQEKWGAYDIGSYNTFYNATIEITEYISIEKKDGVDGIKIIPTIKQDNPLNTPPYVIVDELEPFNIEFN